MTIIINAKIIRTIHEKIKDFINENTDNIDEVCAKINAILPSGENWSVINCYPAADEENLLLVITVIEGKDYVLEIEFSSSAD